MSFFDVLESVLFSRSFLKHNSNSRHKEKGLETNTPQLIVINIYRTHLLNYFYKRRNLAVDRNSSGHFGMEVGLVVVETSAMHVSRNKKKRWHCLDSFKMLENFEKEKILKSKDDTFVISLPPPPREPLLRGLWLPLLLLWPPEPSLASSSESKK